MFELIKTKHWFVYYCTLSEMKEYPGSWFFGMDHGRHQDGSLAWAYFRVLGLELSYWRCSKKS